MLLVRFKVRCQPGRTQELAEAMTAVVQAARKLPGVIHFDIGHDITDGDALIATEVFEDRAAMEREEALPAVARVVELMQSGVLAGQPEWTVYEIASSESPGARAPVLLRADSLGRVRRRGRAFSRRARRT